MSGSHRKAGFNGQSSGLPNLGGLFINVEGGSFTLCAEISRAVLSAVPQANFLLVNYTPRFQHLQHCCTAVPAMATLLHCDEAALCVNVTVRYEAAA